jgi:hypothetical protein
VRILDRNIPTDSLWFAKVQDRHEIEASRILVDFVTAKAANFNKIQQSSTM